MIEVLLKHIPKRNFGMCSIVLNVHAGCVCTSHGPAALGDWFWELEMFNVSPAVLVGASDAVCRSGMDCGGEEMFTVKRLNNALSDVARLTRARETRREIITAALAKLRYVALRSAASRFESRCLRVSPQTSSVSDTLPQLWPSMA